ncbi:hypothetical protein DPMN_046566 [Dreissena polymorpha]|uniref:Uncharacterized protein n=1 Tax=Dreissena polymorpha TaxID=45954 RepID=A0A9D4D650_DREPO|nr:hypothetical protein DPMN_046566 [Dreissena polymorpha]
MFSAQSSSDGRRTRQPLSMQKRTGSICYPSTNDSVENEDTFYNTLSIDVQARAKTDEMLMGRISEKDRQRQPII